MVKTTINGKDVSTESFQDIFPFGSNFLDINGFRVHYLDRGSGKVVVMLHGNPTWSFYFRNLVCNLEDTFRCVVPDHVGCGLSDKPHPRMYPYTLDRRVRDFDQFINSLKLDKKITLILHDWGGMIGLAWAVDNLSRIDKLVITNTSGFLIPPDKKLPFRLWFFKYLTPLALPAVLGFNLFSVGAAYMAPRKRLSKKVRTALTAPYNSWKNRWATLKFVQDIPLTPKDKSFITAKRVDDSLYQLKSHPILILWGKRDFVFDVNFFNEWKKRFPKAQTYLFEDAGHYLFEDKPRETSQLVKQFLQEDTVSF